MYLYGTDIECWVDRFAPDRGLFMLDMPVGPFDLPPPVFVVDPPPWGRIIARAIPAPPPVKQKTKPVVFGSPGAWCEIGAHNVARAYAPEGVP